MVVPIFKHRILATFNINIQILFWKPAYMPFNAVFNRFIFYSNMTSFFRFARRASYSFGIISLAHAPVNVTDFSIGSINCNPNNADRGCSIIRVT
jgi:hypothetical protein